MTRLLAVVVVVGIVCTLVSFPGTEARADDSSPAAMVVADDGAVLAVVPDRNDVRDAVRRAGIVAEGRRLRVEYVYRSHATVQSPPNDPIYHQQLNFDAIGVPAAWSIVDGSGVIVAVLDAAVNFGGNDGFCGPIVSPYDALTGLPGFAPLSQAPFGHGTHVAGTVSQCTNNHIGVAGIAPAASLMPVRVLSDDGVGTSSQLADGIDWAVDHGADVVNLSLGSECTAAWGPSCSDSTVDAAISRAKAMGVVIVASSGNSGGPFMAYPAAHPHVVAVGAIDSSNNLWSDGADGGTNTGSALDLVAPGVGVIQEATAAGAYDYYAGTGTSMAAPHVAATAALMLSANPTMTVSDVVDTLRSTAVDLGTPGRDDETGWGRVNTAAAVAEAASGYTPPADPCTSGPCDTVARVDTQGYWGVFDGLTASPSVTEFFFGNPGDVPFMGDWDGDGVGTPGLYRQGDGFVYVRHS
ncbi:MAG: S8 family serine peptidase, partial [Acidimicrobiia bacterium]